MKKNNFSLKLKLFFLPRLYYTRKRFWREFFCVDIFSSLQSTDYGLLLQISSFLNKRRKNQKQNPAPSPAVYLPHPNPLSAHQTLRVGMGLRLQKRGKSKNKAPPPHLHADEGLAYITKPRLLGGSFVLL